MLWSGFGPPTLKLTQEASVLSSNNFEKIVTKNTFNNSLGAMVRLGRYQILSGVSHYQSPLDSDFSGSGNTIDSDVTSYHLGITRSIGKLSLIFSTQLKQLKNQTVLKTSGQENGNNGQKIGAPGFTIGGDIININLGVSYQF